METFKVTFLTSKKYKPTKETFLCTKNLHVTSWNSARVDYSELSNILSRAVKGEYFAKGTEKKNKFLGNLLDKRVQKLEDHSCPKIQISLIKKIGFAPVTHSDTRPHFTVWSARQKCTDYPAIKFVNFVLCFVLSL